MRMAICYCSSLLFAALAYPADRHVFETASVKVAGPDVRRVYGTTGGPGTSDPGLFRAPCINMALLLRRAFGVNPDQIEGPEWSREAVSSLNYTVEATIPPGANQADFQEMFLNLLVERFHLVYHRETREFPSYELTVDKGGPKIKEIMPGQPPSETAVDDGFPKLPPGPRSISIAGPDRQLRTKFQEQTMADLALRLGTSIGTQLGKSIIDGYRQPRVADKTGLTGRYTFLLEYYNPDDGGPSLFEAIQKQLGLRLDKAAPVSLPVFVIDSLNKSPTPD